MNKEPNKPTIMKSLPYRIEAWQRMCADLCNNVDFAEASFGVPFSLSNVEMGILQHLRNASRLLVDARIEMNSAAKLLRDAGYYED